MRAAFLSLLLASTPAFAAPSSASSASSTRSPLLSVPVAQLTVLRRVTPGLPRSGALAEPVACAVDVAVDGGGQPTGIQVSGCPDAYVVQTRDAMAQWRWSEAPAGTERRVQMTIRYPAAAPSPASSTPTDARGASTSLQPLQADARPKTVVCTADILRNRRGMARKIEVVTCPAAFREAAEGAATALSDLPADPAGREAPRLRPQRVTLTFEVASL